MQEKKYIVELTESEANAIVDAIENVANWTECKSSSDAAMKIIDAMNGFDIKQALDGAEKGFHTYHSSEEVERKMAELYNSGK